MGMNKISLCLECLVFTMPRLFPIMRSVVNIELIQKKL